MITGLLLGAIALGLMGAHKQQISGVGKLEPKRKRRIFLEMGDLQENGFDLDDKFEDLREDQKAKLRQIMEEHKYKASSRSSKSPEELFYNSVRRMYQAISGVGSTKLPAKAKATIKNGRGDVIMQYIDFGTPAQIFNDAMNWFYDEFVAPGLDGYRSTIYYIAKGGKLLWDGGKNKIKRGIKNECFFTRGNASAERRERISYISKTGMSIDELTESIYPEYRDSLDDFEQDFMGVKNGVIEAIRDFSSVGQCQKYIADAYLSQFYVEDEQEYIDVPF